MKKKAKVSRKPIRRKPTRNPLGRPIRLRQSRSRAKANMIYEFKTTKARLAALPEEARIVLLLGGHIVNEINTLFREFIFNMKAYDDSVKGTYAGIHMTTIMRLMIGKVTEGLETVQNRVFKSTFARDYLPLVEKRAKGKAVVARLKAKMNDQGLLRRLRNEHVFHNPADKLLLAAFDSLPEGEDWRMLASGSRQSVRFPMSQIVAMRALLDATRKDNPEEALALIRDEVLNTSSDLAGLFEEIVIALSKETNLFDPVRELKDISDAPDPSSVDAPPLLRDDMPNT